MTGTMCSALRARNKFDSSFKLPPETKLVSIKRYYRLTFSKLKSLFVSELEKTTTADPFKRLLKTNNSFKTAYNLANLNENDRGFSFERNCVNENGLEICSSLVFSYAVRFQILFLLYFGTKSQKADEENN